jgi:dihydrolipoamide dehydrogenase
MPDSDRFDLIVLGAGTGGYSAAFRASQLGMRVALVDEGLIGGTCLHRGCIPTKALLESADVLARVRKAKEFGVLVDGSVGVDYALIAARRDAVVKRMWTGLKSLVKRNGVEWVQGRGRLDGPTTVHVTLAGDDGAPAGVRVLQALDVILATGSRTKSLPGLVPDGTRILTSDDVLRRESLPASIAIVGAGAVGVEFASFFHDMGTKVTLLEYLPAIVPLEDADVSAVLERSFTRRGIDVVTRARFDTSAVAADEAGIRVDVVRDGEEGTREVRAEVMLVATGRAANVEGVGIETTAAVVDRGIVVVDDHMRTAADHLYAIGDIVGGLWLAHTAAHEGLIAVHTIAGEDVEGIDYLEQPRATYCRPEIASIGLTEAQCVERGLPVKIGKVPFQAIAKAVIGGEYEGFAKIIAHAGTGDLLGVHIIGPHATDLIAEASLAVLLEAQPWEIGLATHPHPTNAEVLAEAAMAVDGRSINF